MNRSCSLRNGAAMCAFIALLTVACDVITEAEFRLSSDSRLPVWFVLPRNIQRTQCSVLYTIYGPERVRVRLYGPNDTLLADIRPMFEGRVDQEDLRGKHIEDVFDKYPSYTVLSYNGKRDVIEVPRMGPVFRMVDDQQLIDKVVQIVVAK